MSSPARPMKSATETPRPNLWIVDWRQDLMWFVAPPLAIIPLFALLQRNLPLADIAMYVASLGAVGHHLPGMLRAYGDRELFQRYRLRFIIAPIVLLAVSIAFSFHRPHALAIVVLLWGFWHAQAQAYGFLRIYDVKSGGNPQVGMLLDRLLCLSWFTGGLVMSSGRVAAFLRVYYEAGGPFIFPPVILALQSIVMAWIAVSTIAYAVFTLLNWRAGRRPSPVKFLSLTISFAFWWYCMVWVDNIILGVALFEVFHDVQYLAIVWFFNLRRAAGGPAAGKLTRFLFRRNTLLAGLYVGLVLAYGVSDLSTEFVDNVTIKTILIGIFTASGFLHFYYDGFIWRIRDQNTRNTLGMQGEVQAATQRFRDVGWQHVCRWSLFALPLLMLSLTHASTDVPRAVLQTIPQNADAQYHFAKSLFDDGDLLSAETHARRALRIRQDFAQANSLLGQIALGRNQPQQAIIYLQRAVTADPFQAAAHFNLGTAFIRLNQIDQATQAYYQAIRQHPAYEADAYNNLGSALMQHGAFAEAEMAFRHATDCNAQHVNALCNLAQTLAVTGRNPQEAAQLYRLALDQHPDYVPAMTGLANLQQLQVQQTSFE